MRKTWRLVYNYLLTFIGSFISKRRNARFAVGVLFVLGIGALMVFLFTNTAIATTVKFAQLGVPELAMYSNSFMAILIILFLTVMRSALPAKTTDEQLLLSLPIKKTQIILAKSLFNYLFDFLSLLGILFSFLYCVCGYQPSRNRFGFPGTVDYGTASFVFECLGDLNRDAVSKNRNFFSELFPRSDIFDSAFDWRLCFGQLCAQRLLSQQYRFECGA
jgi:hypothetical protein